MTTTSTLSRPGVWLVPALIGVLFALGMGCSSSSSPTTVTPGTLNPPTNLIFSMADNPPQVILIWTNSTSDVDGYAIYRSDSTMVGLSDAQIALHRLVARNITSFTYSDSTPPMGQISYYAVRAVKGSDISQPTDEINTAPREYFSGIKLAEFASDSASGLELSTGLVWHMTSAPPNDNTAHVNVYLGTTAVSGDSATADLAFKSPYLLGSAWSKCDIKALGSGVAWDSLSTSDTGWSSEVDLGPDPNNEVVALRTPLDQYGHRNYAKIHVTAAQGSAGNRVLTLEMAYQPVHDYIRFHEPN